jgi:hypothetical protein
VFTRFNCALVTTQDIPIVQVPQIGEIASGVRETSKLRGTQLIWLFPIGMFTQFNCALVTTQDNWIDWVPQIEEFTMGVPRTSIHGGTRLT